MRLSWQHSNVVRLFHLKPISLTVNDACFREGRGLRYLNLKRNIYFSFIYAYLRVTLEAKYFFQAIKTTILYFYRSYLHSWVIYDEYIQCYLSINDIKSIYFLK